ncbi:MAG: hypothetical protein GVY19_04870 [Bacteroidetes bacterium]|jgi:nickel-dependent lactate racemase|nr:hypothetical protein [Bacteroidota bacterium]
MNRKRNKDGNLKRTNRTQILLNNREMHAINKYCERFKVSNRSKFMREAIITEVLKKFDENLPSLFEEEHPTLFSKLNK